MFLLLSGCVSSDSRIDTYFVRHPESLQKALENLALRQEQDALRSAADRIKMHEAQIYNSSANNTVGDPAAPRKLVMFIDHNCHFCKQALEAVLNSPDVKDGKLLVIAREFPVIAKTSPLLARYALAAAAQGRYEDFNPS